MKEFRDREFHRSIDRGGGSATDCRFINCQFVNSGFSLTSDPDHMSIARHIVLEDCHICNTDVGPSVLEDIEVVDLSTDGIFIAWSPYLRHVTFRGKNGRLKINRSYSCVDFDPEIQQRFLTERTRFYEGTDWALDLSEAHFKEVDIVGVPVELIRRDPTRQFVVTRSRALQADWRMKVRSTNDFWVWMIDEFLKDGEPSMLVVSPEEGSKKELAELTWGLNELRDLGVVT
jgi:hypothetical protein